MIDQEKSSQTRAGLQRARAAGKQLGRPSRVTAEVRARIAHERAQGRSLRQIAAGLDRDGIPTGHGSARWQPGSVAWILRTLPRAPSPAPRRSR